MLKFFERYHHVKEVKVCLHFCFDRAEVPENQSKGEILLRITATDDDDLMENRKIDFSILTGNQEGMFQIGQSTGQILLVGELDHERTERYLLQVMAKDRGEPPLNSTTVITLDIVDVNDNAPSFNQSEYMFSVNESVPITTSCGQVYARDRDSGLNGRVEYAIESGNDYNYFTIDRDSGTINVLNNLDHETKALHRLIIKAEDSSLDYDKKSVFTTVTINVTDVNEFQPKFPVIWYYESMFELQDAGTFVFKATAHDKDGGYYGIVEYSLLQADGNFDIDPFTGDVVSKRVFTYSPDNKIQFYIQARDKGGEEARVQAVVNITPQVELVFSQSIFDFVVPGNAKKGDHIGRVQAVDKEGKVLQFLRYSLKEEHEYFGINGTTGDLYVVKDLQTEDRRQRRSLSRVRRSLTDSNVTLTVMARAGSLGLGPSVETTIVLMVDRTCPGCAVDGQSGGPLLSGTPLVLLIVFLIIAVILVVVIVVMYMRGREKKRHPPASQYDSSSFETIDVPPPPVRNFPPPPYNEANGYAHQLHGHNMTTSEASDQSHSASSGRGSAEEGDDMDEEIRMINATPLQTQGLRMPDSGIQQDDDALSEHSFQNHQEYLAKLGIDTSKFKVNSVSTKSKSGKSGMSTSVESMHHFSDEGGGESDGLDIGNLVYAKLDEVSKTENLAIMDGTRQFGYGDTDPSNTGSLSSVINSEEEFSGCYNTDYLLDWGPQYQPLADVFIEIARLKDDNIKPKIKPTHIVPQGPFTAPAGKGNKNNSQAMAMMPPPIITDAPPKSIPLVSQSHQSTARASQSNHSNSSSNTNTLNSARTSQLTNVSLPKSPISYESSFTSPAMSPSFTPSLSPLATRSPSISPLMTPKGMGSSHSSIHNGTPQRSGLRMENPVLMIAAGSSGDEREIQI